MQEIKKWLNHTFSVHSGRRLQLSCLSWLSWLSVTSLSCEVAQITSQMAEKAKSSERCRVFFQRTKAQRILSMSRNLVTDTITYLLLGASKGRGWTREESENSWNFWMLEDGMEIIELFLLIQNSFMIWSVLVNIMWWLLVLVDGSWKKLANESRFAAVTNVLDGVCYWPENYQKQSLNGLGCKKRHHTPFQPLQLTFFWWEIYIDKVYTIDHYSDQCLIHDQLQHGPNWPRDETGVSTGCLLRLGPSDLKDTDVSCLLKIDPRGSSDALQWFFPTKTGKSNGCNFHRAGIFNLNHQIFVDVCFRRC